MDNNFILSSKRALRPMGMGYHEDDVREFVKLLKEEIPRLGLRTSNPFLIESMINPVIDKLAGSRLVDTEQSKGVTK